MLNFIDGWLNKITMYRLVLYCLAGWWLISLVFSYFGLLSYQPLTMAMALAVILAVAWITNGLFARVFFAPSNPESVLITALILALIISPVATSVFFYPFLVWVAIWAMAAKYILAIKKKHLFNPAAFAVALTAFTIGQSASWWIGTAIMLPFVLLGGLLIAKKLRRFDLVLSFLATVVVAVIGYDLLRTGNVWLSLKTLLLDAPLFFFAVIMLTEPMTTPPTRRLRLRYGILVGFLFAPFVHLGPIFSTPELALLVGNVFSYLVSPKQKLILQLREKIKLAADAYDFIFTPSEQLVFQPGQYLEWTLPHTRKDSRGMRRYFTLANSPTERDVRLGVKFYSEPSSFKRALWGLKIGDKMVASQLAGDFTLPKNPKEKLVFIAGGIGITPFRSMIKYLLDKRENRSIVLFYSNKTPGDVLYREIFDQARREIGLRTIYTVTDIDHNLSGWTGRLGLVTGQMIREEVPDYRDRTFYLSGPRSMVVAFEQTLNQIGLPRHQIKTDYFPGFA